MGTEEEEEGEVKVEYMTAAFVCGFSSVKDEGNVHLLDSMYLKGQYAICIIVKKTKKNNM